MKTSKSVAFESIVFDVYLKINVAITDTQYPVFKGAYLH